MFKYLVYDSRYSESIWETNDFAEAQKHKKECLEEDDFIGDPVIYQLVVEDI